MNKSRALPLLSALIASTMLSACGGGGSFLPDMEVPDTPDVEEATPQKPSDPVAPQEPSPAPASMTNADLIRFARDGDGFQEADFVIYSRPFQQDGETREVGYITAIDDHRSGLVVVGSIDNEITFDTYLADGPSTAPAAGFYDGQMLVQYRMPGRSGFHHADGDFGFEIDGRTGEVFLGGMATGSDSSVEIYADAMAVGGEFSGSGSDVIAVLRGSDGEFLTDSVGGRIDGALVDIDGGRAGYGTFTSDNGAGFSVNGGFATLRQ